jgi:phospholipid/cholesterol/gamma-HCH transport system substrate-binding protein
METRASYILVGSFVLALLAGLFVFTAWIAKVQFEETRSPYYIYFTGSVTGLQPGSPVRYRGIPVGTVADIRLDPNNVTRVRVRIEVDGGTPIKTDSIASLEVQGITGGSYVQISGGTAESEPLKDTDGDGIPEIPSRPSPLSAVVDAAPQILDRTLEVTNRVLQLLSPENQTAIARTLANTESLTADLSKAAAGLEGTMAQLNTVLHSIEVAAPSIQESMASMANSGTTIKSDFNGLAQALKATSTQLNTLLEENREPLRDFTGSGLYEMTLLITQLRDLSGQLSRVVTRIENSPSNFLFGGTGQGVEVRGR